MNSTQHKTLSQRLLSLIDHNDKSHLTIGEMLRAMGEQGFGVILLILSMPSALPVPAVGYSTFFGFIISGLAVQMIFCRKTPWLPEKAKNAKIPFGFAKK